MKFVKDTGNNVQLRIKEFTPHVVQRCYKTMVPELAQSVPKRRENERYDHRRREKSTSLVAVEDQYFMKLRDIDEGKLWFLGEHGRFDSSNTPLNTPKNVNEPSFFGYTSAKFCLDNRDVIFHCASRYGGIEDWYDWCLVQRENSQGEVDTYPGQILGFFRYQTDCTVEDKDQPEFVCEFKVDATNQGDLCVVPISSIEDTLFVFKNYGCSTKSHFCVLPTRRHRSLYFGDKINIPTLRD
ncbi:hypothetical protein ACHAWF_006655 [Thalassiosira exigua]